MNLLIRSTLISLSILTFCVFAKDKTEATVISLLQESGATQYSVNNEYGGGLEKLYLGYDSADKPIVGIATRMTKTYEQVLTIIAVVPEEGGYKISKAVLPEGTTLSGKPNSLTLDALEDITGKTFENEAETKGLVDATSEATKYLKQIYVSYSLMAKNVIKELKANPTWTKTAVPQK
jgi:hypothetical protein